MSRTLATFTRLSLLRPTSSPSVRSFSGSSSLAKVWCVRNLAYSVTEHGLEDYLFDKVGVRGQVNIIGGVRRKKGVDIKWSRGYGFLKADAADGAKIMSVSGQDIDGREIQISEYTVKESEKIWASDMDKWLEDDTAPPPTPLKPKKDDSFGFK